LETMKKTVRTACPRNCYSTCGMLAEVEDGKLVRVTGDPLNKATHGHLCLKGLTYPQRVYAPDRLLYPLRRTGGRGEGKWRRITWDEAYAEIAAQLQRVKAEYGPEAVFYYNYSGASGLLAETLPLAFWHLYGGYTGTYGSLCWAAGLEGTRLSYGENKHSAPWDLAKAKLIVVWGKNPAFTNVQEMKYIDAAVANGAELVVIDVQRTPTADKADIFLQPRPGTDGALALGLANVVISLGLQDTEFIDRHTTGFAEYKELAAQYPPERTEAITGIPAEAIIDLATRYARTKPANIVFGYGPQRFTNGGQTVRAASLLPALTGNVGQAGGGWTYANLQGFLPHTLPLPPAPERVRLTIPIGKLATGLAETDNPPLRFGWVQCGNPATCNPNTSKVTEGLKRLDFLVVVEQFLTDTAELADIVLPAKTLFEETDVISGYWHSYIQIRDKVIEPPGEVKPESLIFRELAERMGFPLDWFPADPDAALDAVLAKCHPDLSLARLREGPVFAPWAQEIAWADYHFATPSGKIEFYSKQAAEKWGVNPLPDFTEPVEGPAATPELHRKYPLQLMTAHPRQRIHSQFNNLGWMAEINPVPEIMLHPRDAAARKIADGERVRVYNDRGELRLKAVLDWGVRPGLVNIYEGWWNKQGGAVNLLSADRMADMGNGTAFHDCLVEVEKI